MYVEDVAEAIVKILEKCKEKSAVYNVGSGRLTSVVRVANLVTKEYYSTRLANSHGHIRKAPMRNKMKLLKEPKKTEGFYADISKIKKEIGWMPKVSIEEGVRRTIKTL